MYRCLPLMALHPVCSPWYREAMHSGVFNTCIRRTMGHPNFERISRLFIARKKQVSFPNMLQYQRVWYLKACWHLICQGQRYKKAGLVGDIAMRCPRCNFEGETVAGGCAR